MKTILVPTDFSPAANNAARYALALAGSLEAEVILYHTYHLPVSTAEVPMLAIPAAELEQSSMQRLEECRTELLREAGARIQVTCITTPGFAVDEINDIVESRGIDLVVMGNSGHGKIRHTFWGTVTTGVLEQIRKPLLIVPEGAGFNPLSRIGFACDYCSEVSPAVMRELKELTETFHSELCLISVEKPDEKISSEKALAAVRLETELAGVQHSIHFPVSKNVVEGLLEFEQEHKVDLLVMIPRQHSFLEKLFHPSQTRGMVFHSNIPVLALKE